MRLILTGDLHNLPGHAQIADPNIHNAPLGHETGKPAQPTPEPAASEHRDRLAKALKALDDFHATKGVDGTKFTSASGREHRVGDRVSVSGHTGRIVRKHGVSGLPEIAWDK